MELPNAMLQVLFRIPINLFGWTPQGIPIYGFGAMFVLAFLVCTWLAGRRAEKEGIRKQVVQDLAGWLLLGGIIGARLTSVLFEYQGQPKPWLERLQVAFTEFFKIWEGGLVLYGSVIGGGVGYLLAYYFVVRR